MAIDVDEKTYPISYDQYYRNTYSYATKYVINQHSDLEILRHTYIFPGFSHSGPGPRNLATWTPDFRHDPILHNELWAAYGTQLSQHRHDRFYNATGLSKASVVVDDSLELRLPGVRLGTIKSIADEAGCEDKETPISQNVRSGGQWSRLATSLCPEDGIYAPTGEPIQLAYSRLRIRDYLPDETTRAKRKARPQPFSSIPEPKESAFLTTPNNEKLLHNTENITVSIRRSCRCNKLALLSSGQMSLVHQSCVPGDEVWLLMGGDMPFVLRPLTTGRYGFKGEAYVHGIMEGEYLIENFKSSTDGRDDQA